MKKIIIAVFAAVALILGVSTSAYAHADGPQICNSGACVWFKNDGDYIYVRDEVADGHSAVAQVCSPGPASCGYAANYLWNHEGAGTTYKYGYGTSIPEGATVYYRACIGEWNGGGGHEHVTSCSSGWTHGTA